MRRKGYFKKLHKIRKKKFPLGIIRTVILDHWEEYVKDNYVRPTENENVLKMLSCRTPLLGKHIYKCPQCGKELEVPHSCKSRFCSLCGYVANINWMRDRFPFILDCHYHHVVVTVPAYFRWIIKRDRVKTLNLFIRTAADVILEWAQERGYQVGIVCFFHSFGDTLQFHPHFHLLVTAGGLKKDGTWHYADANIPGHVLMPIFKARFTDGIKKFFDKGVITTKAPLSRIKYQISHQHDKHWQFYTQRVTREGPETMMYCARYCKKMIISEERIIDYDGQEITLWNSKRTKTMVYTWKHFIKCILQHIPEKNFRIIRYYGFYSNRSKKKYDLAKKYWKPLIESIKKLDWRTRQMLKNANDPEYPKDQRLDPLICSECGETLVLHKIIYPEPRYKRTFENIKIILGIAVEQKLALNSS